MCGIAGIISSSKQVSSTQLEAMVQKLRHRGPDGQKHWLNKDKNVGLAHARLAIIDPGVKSDQPFHDESGRYSIVFNGEIYNFLELRTELEALGSHFITDGDTEVILAAWHHWGPAMFVRMNGMWAIAIYDKLSGNVTFSRDRFGIKPLYYSKTKGTIAFASEMRALMVLPWIDREPDADVVRRTLFDAFTVEASERTYIRGIYKLPAGHYAILKSGNLQVERWWQTCNHLVRPEIDFVGRTARFKELFLDAVRLRMRSDVAIGTCLSGGFDSSAITCAISTIAEGASSHLREASDWRHAFVASFPGEINDETAEAKLVAKYAGIEPKILPISSQSAIDNIEAILDDLDDVYIIMPSSVWDLYAMIRKQGVYVTIDGHGADELMGGYRQTGMAFSFHMRNLAEAIDKKISWLSIIDTVRSIVFSRSGMQFLKGYQYKAPPKIATPFDLDTLPKHWGHLSQRLYKMFHITILPTILRNFDRMSMAHGIESRMPFMDWRVVTYVMSLSDHDKSYKKLSKYIAREAMAGLMPEEIRISPRKVGFSSPMVTWLNGPLAPWVKALFEKRSQAYDEIVDTGALLKQINFLTQNKSWTFRHAEHIWPYIQMRYVYSRLECK